MIKTVLLYSLEILTPRLHIHWRVAGNRKDASVVGAAQKGKCVVDIEMTVFGTEVTQTYFYRAAVMTRDRCRYNVQCWIPFAPQLRCVTHLYGGVVDGIAFSKLQFFSMISRRKYERLFAFYKRRVRYMGCYVDCARLCIGLGLERYYVKRRCGLKIDIAQYSVPIGLSGFGACM